MQWLSKEWTDGENNQTMLDRGVISASASSLLCFALLCFALHKKATCTQSTAEGLDSWTAVEVCQLSISQADDLRGAAWRLHQRLGAVRGGASVAGRTFFFFSSAFAFICIFLIN